MDDGRRDAATATIRDRSQSESALADAGPSLAGVRATRVRLDLACRPLSAAEYPRRSLSRRLDAVGGARAADRETAHRDPREQQHLPPPAADCQAGGDGRSHLGWQIGVG